PARRAPSAPTRRSTRDRPPPPDARRHRAPWPPSPQRAAPPRDAAHTGTTTPSTHSPRRVRSPAPSPSRDLQTAPRLPFSRRQYPRAGMTFTERLAAALAAGTSEHYADAALYDHEYKRRRDDVRWYRELAGRELGSPAKGPILELGCGSGRALLPLVRDGWS